MPALKPATSGQKPLTDCGQNRTLTTVQHQGTLNKALRRIIRDCNDEILLKGEENPVLLPRFSCHNLRHTFATRLCEADVNIKVIQDTLGHKDISTTMEIYAEATKNYKQKELGKMEVNDDLWAI